MAPAFKKGDRVKLKATLFDNGKRDRNGLLFSEDWLAKGNGEWCYGTVSFVYVKKGRQAQKYRVKYDGGQTMTSLEDQMEVAGLEEENSDESSAVDELEGSDYEASDGSGSTHDLGRVRGVQAERDTPEDTDPEEEAGNVTDDSEGENGEDKPMDERDHKEPLKLGDEVEAHGIKWERVDSLRDDCRTEPEESTTFKNIRFDESTKEVDVFLQLLPLPKTTLLEIVRDGGRAAKDRRTWEMEHIEAALCIIFGGAQYKAGTNLWATKKKGMLKPPDFGLYLSHDRFEKILRYWARGPDGTKEKLREIRGKRWTFGFVGSIRTEKGKSF